MAEGPESTRKVDESEFLEMSGQDPAQAGVLRRSLEELASGRGGDALREMAQEVLSGRASLRDAVDVSAYSDQLVAHAAPMAEKWAALSDAEREALAAEGERSMAEAQARIDEERRTPQGDGGKKSRHDGRGWSLY
ncbi:hypothetical protein GCM10009730_07960 [Streptomyces albidochromogenes]|uniref:hypothetical protein n=1 Tax=Streptomyces albidochromogenes TaxID=329524 RepID=UPI00110FAFBD|nr:hypothetical protein [Streptomyces albidochromogenes]